MGRSRFSAFERLRNPAWVGDVVQGEGDRLRPWPDAAPRRLDDCDEGDDRRLGDRSCYAELGRGGFGVVVETQDPSMVLKLTTDRSEAQTAAVIIQHALYTPGVVHYFRAQRLSGLLRHPNLGKTFFGMRDLEAVPEGDPRGVPLYALWRSAAEKVGALEFWTVQTRGGVEAGHLLNHYYEIMGLALDPAVPRGRNDPREQGAFGGDLYFHQSWDHAVSLFESGAIQPYVEDPDDIWQWDETDPALIKALGTSELGANMALALVYAETQLAPLFPGALGAVARSMWDLLLDGVFLSDVRQDNVGWVDDRWAITEVGQALLLGTAYSERGVDSDLRRGVG